MRRRNSGSRSRFGVYRRSKRGSVSTRPSGVIRMKYSASSSRCARSASAAICNVFFSDSVAQRRGGGAHVDELRLGQRGRGCVLGVDGEREERTQCRRRFEPDVRERAELSEAELVEQLLAALHPASARPGRARDERPTRARRGRRGKASCYAGRGTARARGPRSRRRRGSRGSRSDLARQCFSRRRRHAGVHTHGCAAPRGPLRAGCRPR
jgi:hypothetical protein